MNLCNYLNDELSYYDEQELKEIPPEDYLIMTLEIANMIGWKYHPDQQKPKRRGSAEINFKDLTSDLLEENPDEEVKFGRISLKKGSSPEEEEYEIVEETERIKEIIRSKIGEDRLQDKIKKMEEENLKFIFTAIDDPSHYSNIFTKDNFKTLEKWGLIQNMELVKFRFNQNLDLKDLDKFLKDLFNNKNVRNNFISNSMRLT